MFGELTLIMEVLEGMLDVHEENGSKYIYIYIYRERERERERGFSVINIYILFSPTLFFLLAFWGFCFHHNLIIDHMVWLYLLFLPYFFFSLTG